jgi:transposase InsO family protein
VLRTALALLADLVRLLRLMSRSRAQLAAENLFLRKQLACYMKRQIRPRRTDNASRITLVLLSPFVDWRELLTMVQPDTLVRWHRDLCHVFVLLDVGTRRIVHWNVTDHPRSEWTIQQFRNGLPLDATYRFLVHDRDGIFAPAVDAALRSMSLQVLKTTMRAPQANAHCERFIGTARRECLDWVIPLNEPHLCLVLAEWMSHYHGERPHSALGPGLPHDPTHRPALTGHRIRATHRVVANARLGGLHRHYLERIAA